VGVTVATSITDTQGIIAIAAAAAAVVALVCCAFLATSLRRQRAAQSVVLGEHGDRDLIAHGADLEDSFQALRDYVVEVAERLDGRLTVAESGLRGAISERSLVRYDAYNELSGHQSMSIALLDATRSGIVLSSIHHRDQARIYAKQVRNGRGELELSPEEEDAVRIAGSADPGAAPPAGDPR
jgi:hypothetical protein